MPSNITTPRLCSIPDCSGKHLARNLCHRHYFRMARGRPLNPTSRTCEERFWSKVNFNSNKGCWLWTGGTRGDSGYGSFSVSSNKKKRTLASHRVAYELIIGNIPIGLTLDHLCRIRHCVNPFHLEPVSIRENVLRGQGLPAQNARKSHCRHGHLLSEDNIYRPPGKPRRNCRKCAEYRKREKLSQRKGTEL